MGYRLISGRQTKGYDLCQCKGQVSKCRKAICLVLFVLFEAGAEVCRASTWNEQIKVKWETKADRNTHAVCLSQHPRKW